ncbi:hypothetical protein Salat_1925900 [Sesamum alatum]|uniref:Uncharacterized protein n=1 Tax=Sesamum alatum TaxID=300844 RepID=A0AAE1Y477_9LAMI|nr:hypothetical protein Salat_1925900 [Sesamum alatum]
MDVSCEMLYIGQPDSRFLRMTLVDEEGSSKPRADDGVEDDTQDCYVPTAEWCPNTGYAGNDNVTARETQGNVEVNVTSTASKKKNGSSGKKRKAKMIVQDDGLTNVVNTFCDSANERLGELSKKLFADFDEIEKRSSVYEAVGKVAGIDLNDQILLSDRLVENSKKMDLFFSLPEDARARMIRLMVDGKM